VTVLTLMLLLAFDGGVDSGSRLLTAEVVDNLELLQNLDSASDLELLEELSLDR
jgi:hypothetical protein